MNSQRQAAKKFKEFWLLAKDSETGGYSKFWLSLLSDVLGVDDVFSRIDFQSPVPMKGTTKYLDAWIPETRVLIEHKSRGIKLDAPQSGHGGKTPYEQALEYNQARGFSEKARWIVTCNFDEIWVYDMDKPLAAPQKILLANLPREVSRLCFLVDSTVKSVREQEKDISIKAGRIVGELYKALLKRYGSHAESQRGGERGGRGELGEIPQTPSAKPPPKSLCDLGLSAPLRDENLAALNRLCVRLVFCFYAEDAELFPKDTFWNFLSETPAKFLRDRIIRLFRTLDTPEDERDPYLEPELAAFPYTNGGLFKGVDEAEIPPLDDEIRELLIKSADFDWRDISPTIFGALFESTLNPETRRAGGMIYTSIENIHRVIDPLFMNDLTAELESIKSERAIAVRRAKAAAFQEKLGSLTFLDPACGSGNFLTETFLSLRKLENEAIVVGERLKPGEVLLNLDGIVKVSIKQFHGIEINDFAVSVAKTAMWISEAKMLQKTAEILAVSPKFLPLHDYDGIVEGNALRMDWGAILTQRRRDAEVAAAQAGQAQWACQAERTRVPSAERHFDYIMGNPPFCGKSFQSQEQKNDMAAVFNGIKDYGNLDYVTCWFKKAADFMRTTNARTAFVATNSICQGIAVPPLWSHLFSEGVVVDFAWRTFRWDSEASEKAHVHCVIIGFHPSSTERNTKITKTIYDGEKAIPASRINAYLIDAPNIIVEDRATPLCDVPPMSVGSFATDGGNLILSQDERDSLIADYPEAEAFVRPYYSPEDFINNRSRFCLWLKGVPPDVIMAMPPVRKRIEAVRLFRLASKKAQTRKRADTPTLFAEDRQPDADYLLVPRVSSERRRYVPIGFLSASTIAGDTITLPNATLYHFGVVVSSVHMAWMRLICGRLKSDYRYSPSLVYNTLPWPDLRGSASPREKISQTAKAILDARAKYPDSSYKALYDDTFMPADLRAAHEANDRAVLAAYGLAPDTPEPEIVAHLFGLYAKMMRGKTNYD